MVDEELKLFWNVPGYTVRQVICLICDCGEFRKGTPWWEHFTGGFMNKTDVRESMTSWIRAIVKRNNERPLWVGLTMFSRRDTAKSLGYGLFRGWHPSPLVTPSPCLCVRAPRCVVNGKNARPLLRTVFIRCLSRCLWRRARWHLVDKCNGVRLYMGVSSDLHQLPDMDLSE